MDSPKINRQIAEDVGNHTYLSAAMKHSESCSRLTDFWGDPSNLETQRIQASIENRLLSTLDKQPKIFRVRDLMPFLTQGAEVIFQDDFSLCFESPQFEPWNWNVYLFVLWVFGTALRFCVIFPIRLTIFVVGWSLFAIAFVGVRLIVKDNVTRTKLERRSIQFLANVFILSWTGVIRHHGVIPKHEPNQIYVANHTSMIDYIILMQVVPFATVGQKHKGVVGWIQDNILRSVGGIWLERSDNRDKQRVARKFRSYIKNVDYSTNRLLVFPEGTCVNNNYCVQFKRSSFEFGSTICPVAIKYNDVFVDAYWNSRKKSFQRHLFDLMTSWALVCDVYFLEPQEKLPEEDSIQFAQRVKDMICETAQITGVDWNGYLKYFRPSKRFVEHRQKLFAESLRERLRAGQTVGNNFESKSMDENCSTGAQSDTLLKEQNDSLSSSVHRIRLNRVC
eukprot:35766_1